MLAEPIRVEELIPEQAQNVGASAGNVPEATVSFAEVDEAPQETPVRDDSWAITEHAANVSGDVVSNTPNDVDENVSKEHLKSRVAAQPPSETVATNIDASSNTDEEDDWAGFDASAGGSDKNAAEQDSENSDSWADSSSTPVEKTSSASKKNVLESTPATEVDEWSDFAKSETENSVAPDGDGEKDKEDWEV